MMTLLSKCCLKHPILTKVGSKSHWDLHLEVSTNVVHLLRVLDMGLKTQHKTEALMKRDH